MPKENLPFTEAPRTDGYIEIIDAMRLGQTQTAITLILHFGLAEENEKEALTEKLVSLIRERDTHMATGFVGTPYVLHALSENGRSDVAYELLFQESAPSWLYSVCHGATTMWEHWNSIKEDGTFWSTDMNSFNHYAYGAVFDWIFGVSAGIKALAPAYKEILLAPHPNKKLGFADTSYESRSGLIRSYWCYKDDAIHYEFEVPKGVTAHIELPSGKRESVGGGKYFFKEKIK
jgi:alpha-L-rhamnosidase